MTFDVESARRDFPVLQRTVNGSPLVYLDSAATALRPRPVLDAIVDYETRIGANVHRGGHLLGDEGSEAFEDARNVVAQHLGVPRSDVVFTFSTTYALNLIALGLPVRPGANVVTDAQQHHAALLPWYGRAEVRFADVGSDGAVDAAALLRHVDKNTAAVVLSHASNATGRRFDHAALTAELRRRGVVSILDGAQGAAHGPVSVEALGADFYACSAHKMLGPTGVGVLTGRREALERLGQPIRGGGAVRRVTRTEAFARGLPHALEPGTPAIAAVIGFGAALRYVDTLGDAAVRAHERALTERLLVRGAELPGVELLGPRVAEQALPLVSFVSGDGGLNLEEAARLLSDRHGIMVRAGHLCCHPFFDGIGKGPALRASAHFYNTLAEVDAFIDAFAQVIHTLRGSARRTTGPA